MRHEQPPTPDELAALDAALPAPGAVAPSGASTNGPVDSRFSEAAAKLAAWDQRVAAALQQVAAPAGMQQRLELALARATHRTARTEAAWARGGPIRWRAGAAVAAGIAAVAMTIWLWRPSVWTADALIEAATNWPDPPPDSWQPLASAPTTFAIPREISARAVGWQSARDVRSIAGTLYSLQASGGQAATLLVARVASMDLPSGPPPSPQSTTGGKAVGAWQTGGFVYVLVVEGDVHAYRSCLKVPPQSSLAVQALGATGAAA